MSERIKNFISHFNEQHCNAYLVTHDVNIRYLTGFPASESWLFVTPKKSFYITDFRYILEARRGMKGIAVERFKNSHAETLFELARAHKIKNIGFDDRYLPLALFKKLKKNCPKMISLRPVNNLIEQMREIKNAKEILMIRKALKIHLAAYKYLKKVVKPQMSERQVLLNLECYIKSQGVAFSFDPIIASGPNSCLPHARVTDRKLRKNEPLLIDMGIDVNGYKSDLTRIFFLGKITPLVREIYTIVQIAQRKAINKIQAGMLARDVDYEARNYLKNQRLDKYFGHSLGHGVGLEIHEAPSLSQKSPAVLKENMVVTVEPAVYLPDKFGIRIEDMVLVTQQGCEVLSANYDQ